MSVTRKVAQFIINMRFERLPKDVVEQAKKCFLDWLGVALGGSTYPIADILVDFVRERHGPGQSSIIGRDAKGDMLNVALANGAISHVLDFDDTHLGSLCHVSSPIIPAVLSLAEYHHLSGKDCMTAFVSGFETSAALGLAMGPDHYRAGWHATSTLGHLGATAAAGKLSGLNEKQMRNALGIGATQAGGLQAVFGTMCKPFHPGKAAMDGILSAILAKKGFDSAENIFEDKGGFFEVFSRQVELAPIEKGLGNRYQILMNTFKPYASCLLTHPAINAALDLKNCREISAQDIEWINARVSPLLIRVAAKQNPKTGLEGKFSIYYCLALALAEGSVGENMFTTQKMAESLITDLQKKITIEINPEFDEATAELFIKIRDGAVYSQRVSTPKGDPGNPLSFDELVQKFSALASTVLDGRKSEAIVDCLNKFEELQDVTDLVKLCC